jgi:tetratricopeptide (TPR) repeat protein
VSSYYDLGRHRRPVSTTSWEARLWFDRGLVWTYGFNHEEAIRCFEHASRMDSSCAMAQWGIAYALGANYNKKWEDFDEVDLATSQGRAFETSRRALALGRDDATEAERALIEALQARYQSSEPAPVDTLKAWHEDYVSAMRDVHAAHPRDLDIAALFAEALLNRTPWQLWDLNTGRPTPGASTMEAKQVLERAMTEPEGRVHPGVLHMYIHLMEMSPRPQDALCAADRLRNLVPDAGPLQHMPTHIDVLCGYYGDVAMWNRRAIEADTRYLEKQGSGDFYTLYRAHNYHFLIYGAMFLGQLETALDAANGLSGIITEDLLRLESPPMADWLEAFVPMRMHVLIRFGRWRELIETPLPEDPDLYRFTTALTHYAKGVAFAASGRVEEAIQQRTAFDRAAALVPESRFLFNNSCHDLLAIARKMLEGEVAYRKGHYTQAFAALRKAVELDDSLPYDEPWGWMQPTRHAYGALLLEQGYLEEAAAVYRADLGLDGDLPRAYQHPDNVWSLHGYHECLTLLSRHAEARIIGQRLELAAARADIPIQASCYCRTSS